MEKENLFYCCTSAGVGRGGKYGGRGQNRLMFIEIICLCVWEEICWIYSVAPQKTYSSIFGSPNPSCPRHFYIYWKFDKKLPDLWWWTQVSDNACPCIWLLLPVPPPWNLTHWESHDIFPVFDPTQSHVSLPTLHLHSSALEGSLWLQTVTRLLKFHSFSRDNQGVELT